MTLKACSALIRALILLLATGSVLAGGNSNPLDPKDRYNDYWEEPVEWKELELALPPFPQEKNLVPIYVSAVATNQYLVDVQSLSVGPDGVVRYALLVRMSGGAENISYEGLRCETREWKTYATGRATPEGGVWMKARLSEWRPVENKPVNRHHAALSKDYLCPSGNAVRSAEEGRDALRRGGHPDVPGNRK